MTMPTILGTVAYLRLTDASQATSWGIAHHLGRSFEEVAAQLSAAQRNGWLALAWEADGNRQAWRLTPAAVAFFA
jgi:hypothetical protein